VERSKGKGEKIKDRLEAGGKRLKEREKIIVRREV
jgi:hypothetical protein